MVSKSTIGEDVYKAFYVLLRDNLADRQSPARSASQWIFSAFPDVNSITRDDFPIVVIDKPEFSTENLTLKKNNVPISVTIHVFEAGDYAAKYCDEMADKVVNLINTNKYSSLRNTHRLYNTEIASIDSNVLMHDGLKVHVKSITINTVFRFGD